VIVDESGSDKLEPRSGELADPATVRPRLAEAAAESVDEIRRALLDAATWATKDHWVTFECSECGSRSRARTHLPVPDVRARVAAIELLLREGLGRPPHADESECRQVDPGVAAVGGGGREQNHQEQTYDQTPGLERATGSRGAAGVRPGSRLQWQGRGAVSPNGCRSSVRPQGPGAPALSGREKPSADRQLQALSRKETSPP